MSTVNTFRNSLNELTEIAVWYAEYDGRNESIKYVNEKFATTFGLSIEQILERQTYVLVNPSETTAATIEQYKNEDFEAMQHGSFVSRSRMSTTEDVVVVKLPVDQGVLGMFRIVDSAPIVSDFTLLDLDEEFQSLVRLVSPHLFD